MCPPGLASSCEVAAAFILRGPLPRGTGSIMVSEWGMSGSLLGECNCDWGCPCSFDAPPSHGSCRGVYTWIIDKGAYGDVKLDGLGVALPGKFPGAVHLGHGTQLVLIDGRTTAAQRNVLETLGKGEAGGPFAVFASVTERWLPTVVAPFEVRLNGIRSVLRVDSGSIYDLAFSRIKNPVTVSTAPGRFANGSPSQSPKS